MSSKTLNNVKKQKKRRVEKQATKENTENLTNFLTFGCNLTAKKFKLFAPKIVFSKIERKESQFFTVNNAYLYFKVFILITKVK